MRVFLIGYMGVGKTTIGKKLATSLKLKFIDLDAFISSKEGFPVSKIIQEKGEDDFRNMERKYLLEVSEMEHVLVATGGGTPCYLDNLEVINASGRSVYLEMDEKSLAKRLIIGLDSRPLLKGKTIEELEGFISKHLNTRLPFYCKATITFGALNFNSERLNQLTNLLGKGN